MIPTCVCLTLLEFNMTYTCKLLRNEGFTQKSKFCTAFYLCPLLSFQRIIQDEIKVTILHT